MKLALAFKGGSGSGHRGHAGRPGQRGGSLPGRGGAVALIKLAGADEKILRGKGWKQRSLRGTTYFTKHDAERGYSAQIAPFSGDMWKWKIEASRGKWVSKILAGGTGKTLVQTSKMAENAMKKDYRKVSPSARDLWA